MCDAKISLIADIVSRELMLFAGVRFLVGGFDDLMIDLLFLLRLSWRPRARRRLLTDLTPSPARIAVVVPAWREAPVIGAMLRSALARYRADDYVMWVGVYPNDPETKREVEAVAATDPRLRIAINRRIGPTTKADNLNSIWAAIELAGEPVDAIVIHDAEDVVHPDELGLFAALLPTADVIQLPVVPLIHPRSQLVSGHYADEFAAAHGQLMVVRTAIGAAMPLAGTGCAIAAPLLRRLATARGGAPFDAASLTEDYELGLALSALKVRRVFARYSDADGTLIAARAYFPGSFTAAARQKARWITGIALAGWDRTGWASPLAIADHWMRMRDRRAVLAVLVLAAAYGAVMMQGLCAVLHWGLALPPAAQVPPLLVRVTLILLGWRLAIRCAWTGYTYGRREALWAAPRFFISNAVSLAAAPRALVAYLRILVGNAPIWHKTEHEFPDLVKIAV